MAIQTAIQKTDQIIMDEYNNLSDLLDNIDNWMARAAINEVVPTMKNNTAAQERALIRQIWGLRNQAANRELRQTIDGKLSIHCKRRYISLDVALTTGEGLRVQR